MRESGFSNGCVFNLSRRSLEVLRGTLFGSDRKEFSS